MQIKAFEALGRNLSFLTCANYVFPLLVYPYVSRVLGVEKVGLVGFIDSIATYFILFSMMGISILGVREVARAHGDRGKLRKVFWSLLSIHSGMTVVCLTAMAVMTAAVPELRVKWPMMCVGMSKLVFNLFLVEWFYQGMEEFRYIALRTVAIKIFYVAAVFIFVRGNGDAFRYYFLTMLVVVATGAVNMGKVRGYVGGWHLPDDWRRYMRPYLSLGVYSLLATSYTTLNSAFLGFMDGEVEVGYYSVATKLFQILLSLFAAFTSVMMPRMSSLVKENREDEFRDYISRSVIVIYAVSLPLIVLGEVFAPDIVWLLSGPGYEGAVAPIRIIMPFLLVLGMEQLLVVQALIPIGGERTVTSIAIIAAAVGLALNFGVVPWLGAVGSAIVWVSSETVLFVLSLIMAVRRVRADLHLRHLAARVGLYFPLWLILAWIVGHELHPAVGLAAGIGAAVIWFVGVQLVNPDAVTAALLNVKPRNNEG